MSQQRPETPAPVNVPAGKARSFILWAFLISILLHFIVLPFFGLKAQENQKEQTEKVSLSKKIKVVVPTPPPPTPTPPPPTPPPKSTPPPVKQTNPPPVQRLKLNVPKTTSKGPGTENKYVAPDKGSEDAVPNGNADVGKPGPVTSAPPATPAPTPEPPTPTPKPECANPNADAAIKGSPVEPDYPDIAREQGATGVTQVKVTLDASGNVTDASVYKSAGNPALDQSAIKAAKATAYIPETVNCVKTAGSYIFRAEFTGQ
jgi:TonB family protein